MHSSPVRSLRAFPAKPFPAKQRGMGFVGWLIIILFLGSVLSIGTKLFPLYVNNNTVEDLLDKMSEEAGIGIKPKAEIYNILANRLKLNNIREFDVETNVQVVRAKGGTKLVMDYESRIPLIANVDLIASFDKEVELRN